MTVTMSKQMHQRTGQQKQVWKRQDKVAGVVPEQIGPERGEHECHAPSKLGAKKRTELIASHRFNPSVAGATDFCILSAVASGLR
jgi:hypothetical protein